MNDRLRGEGLCDAGLDLETGILQDLEAAPICLQFLREEISAAEILPFIETLAERLRADAESDLDPLDLMSLEALLAAPAIDAFPVRHSWVH
jgi:hypothetical protein